MELEPHKQKHVLSIIECPMVASIGPTVFVSPTLFATVAKAPAKRLVEHRNALAEEIESGLLGHGPSSSAGPKLSEKNASRHYKGMVARFGLAMRIPVSQYVHVEGGGTVSLPWIRPSDVLLHLMEFYPWLLLGGCSPGRKVEQMLDEFWKRYRINHPTHQVFQASDEKLKRTIPLALHGDGARTQKKQPLEVVSLEAILGLNSVNSEPVDCDCATNKVHIGESNFGSPVVQKLNHKLHSYLSRFLLFAFPSKEFKEMPSLLRVLLKAVGDNLGDICRSGLDTSFGHWDFACIGYKGDQEYHAKTGLLKRSYQNVGHVNFIKCCSECEAGDARFPFEDMSINAAWVQTRYQSLPWTDVPPFSSIPFEPWTTEPSKAGLFLRRDPFHIFRLGVGRNYFASALILLALKGFFDGPTDSEFSFERRMSSAWAHFKLWATSVGESPGGIRSFTREKLHYKNSFPYVGCKGSDTVI